MLFTWCMLELMRLVSEEVGYHGNWAVGAGANRLHGRRRHAGQSRFPTDDPRRRPPAPPWPVTRRLLGPLLRSLGSEALFAQALGNQP
ncbi:hypothetical protein ACFWOJ_36885 [Streptomyces sp. NPDC058439]|uniref:hypothetical protein n=1 Tax=Streptomyces sp. NPDC058439 TaxID=3346500 RepID=UPI003656C8E1